MVEKLGAGLILGFRSFHSLIGQVPVTPDFSFIGQLISDLGIIGVLIWYLWYMTSRVLPRKDKDNKDLIVLLSDTFSVANEKMRSELVTLVVDERNRRDKEVTEYRIMLFDTFKAFRDAVHDVGNNAQLAINKTQELVTTKIQAS